MIKLEVKEYCHNCAWFRPETEVISACTPNGCTNDTKVYCKDKSTCENIHTYILEHELKKL